MANATSVRISLQEMLASSGRLILRFPSVDRFYLEDQDEFFGPAVGAARIWFLTIEHMSIKRMEHVGIVVDDLAAATEFFVELGLCYVRGPEGIIIELAEQIR
jgi:hypothetical protein